MYLLLPKWPIKFNKLWLEFPGKIFNNNSIASYTACSERRENTSLTNCNFAWFGAASCGCQGKCRRLPLGNHSLDNSFAQSMSQRI